MLLAPGGSIHSQRYLRMLLDSGYTVVLVDSYNPIPEGAERYSFIPYPGIFGLERLGLRTINRWIAPWLVALQLRLIWLRVKPDIVHVHWVDQRAYHCALAQLHPLILTCWGSDINNLFSTNDEEDLEYKNWIVKAIQEANHITADTSEIISRCEALTGRKLRSSLYYFGVDMNKFSPRPKDELERYKKELGIPVGARIILSARALRPLMGHHWILDAFSQIARHPNFKDTMLVFKRYLPFQDGYEAQLKKRIQELQLNDRVIWLDPPPNESMPLLYGISDVVVNFPERDGFPVTFFEAAACRRPIVSSGLPAYAEIVTGESCWLVSSGDVKSLERGIMNCLLASESEMSQRLEHAYAMAKFKGEQKISFSAIEAEYQSLLLPSSSEN